MARRYRRGAGGTSGGLPAQSRGNLSLAWAAADAMMLSALGMLSSLNLVLPGS